MNIEDAITKLTQLNYDVLFRCNLDNLGRIHIIKDNTTRVLYTFGELIEFVERKGE